MVFIVTPRDTVPAYLNLLAAEDVDKGSSKAYERVITQQNSVLDEDIQPLHLVQPLLEEEFINYWQPNRATVTMILTMMTTMTTL